MSEFSEDPPDEPASPGEWEEPPSEDLVGDDRMPDIQPTPTAVADRIAEVEAKLVANWLAKHKDNEFVPASRGEARTKRSKFEGERKGWVFKRGELGLGYYRDYGGMVVTVSLNLALHPTAALPPNKLQLDALITSSPSL